jgi:hypothetical protein
VQSKLSLPQIKQHYSCTTQMLDSCSTGTPKTALQGNCARERWRAGKAKGTGGIWRGEQCFEATAGSCLLGTAVPITSRRQVLTHTCNTTNTARRMALVPWVDGRSFQAAVNSCMGAGLEPILQVRVWLWACKANAVTAAQPGCSQSMTWCFATSITLSNNSITSAFNTTTPRGGVPAAAQHKPQLWATTVVERPGCRKEHYEPTKPVGRFQHTALRIGATTAACSGMQGSASKAWGVQPHAPPDAAKSCKKYQTAKGSHAPEHTPYHSK